LFKRVSRTASPRPSISIASREQKWIRTRKSCAGQSGLSQRIADSPSSRWTGELHDGQNFGIS
jgi:hypothetical protein